MRRNKVAVLISALYPPDEQIAPQTQRNRAAFLMLSEYADCVYRAIGKESQYCGTGTPPTTVWEDTFETALGWTTNPNGTDNATTGAWERGNPADTNSGGAKQLGTTVSGVNDLSTGPAAGAAAGDFDIDGGTTSVQSPAVTLPTSGVLRVSLSWYLAHGTNSSTALTSSGSASSTTEGRLSCSTRRGRPPTATAPGPPAAGTSPPMPGSRCASSSRPPTRRPPAWSRRASTTYGSPVSNTII